MVFCMQQSPALNLGAVLNLGKNTSMTDEMTWEVGYVVEPQPGVYKGVVMLDGNSLYGSSGKFDGTGSPRFYTEVVLVGAVGTWLLNQWTSENVVLEGVALRVLQAADRQGNTAGRRIGYYFAHIGLLKYLFGPLFGMLNKNCPGVYVCYYGDG